MTKYQVTIALKASILHRNYKIIQKYFSNFAIRLTEINTNPVKY